MTMPSFRLPIQAVIETVKGFPEQVTLQAQVISRSRSKETYYARIVGGAGLLHSLLVTTWTGGIYAQGDQAFTFLQGAGDLEWHLLPALSSQALPIPSVSLEQVSSLSWQMLRPRCLRPLTPSLLQLLSFNQRHILMIINQIGTEHKTIQEIALLLGKPPEMIYQHLLDLKGKHLIDF